MSVKLVYKGGKAVFRDREFPFQDFLEIEGLKICVSFKEEGVLGTIKEEKEIFLERVELEFEIQGEFTFFKNGFQSWSPSGEVRDELPNPHPLIKALALHWDDPGYLKEIPYFEKSHFLTYLRAGDVYLLLEAADLSVPLVHFLLKDKKLIVLSEIRRSGPSQFTFLDLKIERLTGLRPCLEKRNRIFGWTSWYYYYNHVRPEDVLRNFLLASPTPLLTFRLTMGGKGLSGIGRRTRSSRDASGNWQKK